MTSSKKPIIQKAITKNNDITYGDIITFGKIPDLEVEDLKTGISRFGGYRKPNYFMAYLKSAAILIEHGVKHNTLDDIGLPAFYMQRHALELLLKRVLSSLYEVAELRLHLNENDYQPSQGQKDRLTREHKLDQLWKDLENTSNQMGFSNPPIELLQLIEKIGYFEKSSVTWARYESAGNIEHVKDEVVLPIIDLQKQLEFVNSKISYQFECEEIGNTVHFVNGETYENEIYNAWKQAFLTIEHPDNEPFTGSSVDCF